MPQVEHIGMFTTVDELDDPGVFIGFLDRVEDVAEVRALRKDLVRRLELRSGESVLDVGCGTGDYTREVAALVAPGGRAVGLDFSRAMIGEALTRQASSRLPAAFEQGDAQRLPFDSATFDAARTERMLCHVPDHEAALREMVRVVRPGGKVAAQDVEMHTMMLGPMPDDLLIALKGTLPHGETGTEGHVDWFTGHKLRGYFHTAGLREVRGYLRMREYVHPLTDDERGFLEVAMPYLCTASPGIHTLSEEQREQLRNLSAQDTPESMFRRPDFTFIEGRALAVGVR
jgi:ubiquinone/menaquinone biosynthesis C-methylase UbiE